MIGDSSPADDGTDDTNDRLFNGWSGDAPSGYTITPGFAHQCIVVAG
ncbi:hypothetical protein [Spirosoma sp. KCTC 42546]|nr:hypothetical protein [Spirosoma sp. KCTC 42546]